MDEVQATEASAQVAAFLAYVGRRRTRMLGIGVLFTAVALSGVLLVHGPIRALLALMAVCGVTVAVSSFVGRALLRDVVVLARGPYRTMEMTTWPYRTSGRALLNNAVLVSLDEVGSNSRTPVAEFKARWWTPGIGEAPRGEAWVYGTMMVGATVFAIGASGGVLGKLSRVRPDAAPTPS